MPGVSSICVYSNGDVIRRDYVIRDETPKKEVVLATFPELAKSIQIIIQNSSAELATIPDELYNGTLDGDHNLFRFGEKTISAWTIQRSDIEEIRRINPGYYNQYKDNMKYENLVLDIYDKIAIEINKHNVGIHLDIR